MFIDLIMSDFIAWAAFTRNGIFHGRAIFQRPAPRNLPMVPQIGATILRWTRCCSVPIQPKDG